MQLKQTCKQLWNKDLPWNKNGNNILHLDKTVQSGLQAAYM